MKKIIVLAFALVLAGAFSAQAGFKIGPYVGYDLNFSSYSIPGTSVTFSGGGVSGGLKAGYEQDFGIVGLGLGVTGGYQPLVDWKYEAPGYGTAEFRSYNIPVMAYGQVNLGATYLIGKVGLDNITTSVSAALQSVGTDKVSETKSYMGMAVGAGFRIPIMSSDIEIQALYHLLYESDADGAITLSLGYNFGL